MPGYYDDDDNEYGQPQDGPKALREAHDKAIAKVKELEAKLAEQTKLNDEQAAKLKSTSFRDALADAGLDPKYARFAERDGVEPTAEDVKKWAEENKDVYAFLAPKSEPTREGDEEQVEFEDVSGQDSLDPDYEAQMRAGQQAESTGRPSGSATVEQALASTDVSQFKTREELEKFLFEQLNAPRV